MENKELNKYETRFKMQLNPDVKPGEMTHFLVENFSAIGGVNFPEEKAGGRYEATIISFGYDKPGMSSEQIQDKIKESSLVWNIEQTSL